MDPNITRIASTAVHEITLSDRVNGLCDIANDIRMMANELTSRLAPRPAEKSPNLACPEDPSIEGQVRTADGILHETKKVLDDLLRRV